MTGMNKEKDMQDEMFEGYEENQPKPILSEDQLYEQLLRLNKELNARKEDIAQLIVDNKFHKKKNPQGLDAERVKYIAKSAVREAANDYEEKKIEALTFFTEFERITKYND
jgi:hypothetical protein